MTKRRIAILMHERDSRRVLGRYVITLIADLWREDGHDVHFLFGTGTFVPADVVIVHVDLSVVPEPYFEFARRYPLALNGTVRDIRKSTFSADLLLRPSDAWEGAVIVKSDLNYAGLPERRRVDAEQDGAARRALRRALWRVGLTLPAAGFRSPTQYRVYDRLGDVPGEVFERDDLVVQKFLPERDGQQFSVCNMSFLGDRVSCVRLRGAHPIVNGATAKVVETLEPHPQMLAARERLGFDYGKFDYVVVDGKAILLDANKTVGCSGNLVGDQALRRLRRYRADGLYGYFA